MTPGRKLRLNKQWGPGIRSSGKATTAAGCTVYPHPASFFLRTGVGSSTLLSPSVKGQMQQCWAETSV